VVHLKQQENTMGDKKEELGGTRQSSLIKQGGMWISKRK